jgi:hypothetical protein
MERLKELLIGVKDSYYDFVVGVLNYAKRKDSSCNAMVMFIEKHPEALSSDILEYMIKRDDYYDHAEHIAEVAYTDPIEHTGVASIALN